MNRFLSLAVLGFVGLIPQISQAQTPVVVPQPGPANVVVQPGVTYVTPAPIVVASPLVLGPRVVVASRPIVYPRYYYRGGYRWVGGRYVYRR